jgi:hypothetical protein
VVPQCGVWENTTPKSSTHILGSQDKVPDFADHRFLSSASTVMDAGARVVPSYPGAAVTDCPDVPRSADRLCTAGVKHLLARDVKHHPAHDSDHESRVTGVELALSAWESCRPARERRSLGLEWSLAAWSDLARPGVMAR